MYGPGQSLAFLSDTLKSPGNNQDESLRPWEPNASPFPFSCAHCSAGLCSRFDLIQSVPKLPWAPEGELVMDSYLKGPDSFLARFASLCICVSVSDIGHCHTYGCLPKPQPPTFLSAVAAAESKESHSLWGSSYLRETPLCETLRIKIMMVSGACPAFHQPFLAC